MERQALWRGVLLGHIPWVHFCQCHADALPWALSTSLSMSGTARAGERARFLGLGALQHGVMLLLHERLNELLVRLGFQQVVNQGPQFFLAHELGEQFDALGAPEHPKNERQQG